MGAALRLRSYCEGGIVYDAASPLHQVDLESQKIAREHEPCDVWWGLSAERRAAARGLTYLLVVFSSPGGLMKDDAPREDIGTRLPVRRALELVRVLRRDALRRQQLAQRRVDLDLPRHEGVEAARRARVGHYRGCCFCDPGYPGWTPCVTDLLQHVLPASVEVLWAQ